MACWSGFLTPIVRIAEDAENAEDAEKRGSLKFTCLVNETLDERVFSAFSVCSAILTDTAPNEVHNYEPMLLVMTSHFLEIV